MGNHDNPERLIASGLVAASDIHFWIKGAEPDTVFSQLPLNDRALFSERVSVHGHVHRASPPADGPGYAGVVCLNCEFSGPERALAMLNMMPDRRR